MYTFLTFTVPKHNILYYNYSLGFYTEGNVNIFYIDETFDFDILIFRCLDAMLVDKYNGYTFYVHNLANYDMYFLLPALNRISKKYPNKYKFKESLIFRDGNEIICMKISSKIETANSSKTIHIKLVDSCKLLDSSLDKLCKTFNTEVRKTYFPYNFVSINTLFYTGNKPSIKQYENIDKIVYKNIPKTDWSVKEETLSYLENDLISLYQVM
jgi:hypothetical protein